MMRSSVASLFIPLLALSIIPAALAAEPAKPVAGTSGGQNQGGSRFWGFHRVTDAVASPAMSRILLIGDSIANGYHKEVAKLLKDKANVDLYITPKNIGVQGYCEEMAIALKNGPYAVIHFNESGLHAWQKGRIAESYYGPLFTKAVATLRAGAPASRLIWATNTPATVGGKPGVLDQRLEEIITDMNKAARPIAEKEGMAIDDLHTLMSDKLNLARGDRWHWNAKGQTVQAGAVTASVLAALEKSTSPPAKP